MHYLTEDHRMIRASIREFVEERIAPRAIEFDTTGTFPMDELRAMGDLGFLGIPIPEEYGGIGMDIDYPLHRYYLWAKHLELSLGSGQRSLMRIAAAAAS